MTKTNTEAVEALKLLSDAADALNGSIDEQTYGEKLKLEDWPDDHEFCVNVTAKLESDLNAAIVVAQKVLTALAPTAKTEPSAAGLVEDDEVRRLLRAVYDDLPHTAISPALSKLTGVPLGEVIPFDTAIACGWDFCGYERTIRAILTALSAPTRGRESDWLTQRIAEVVDEGDGFWQACSGCQESVDGCVSTKDYPYSDVFRCQPGVGCSECGGIGVVWDNTNYEDYAKFALALDMTERSAARLVVELQTHVEAADKQVETGQFGQECIAFGEWTWENRHRILTVLTSASKAD